MAGKGKSSFGDEGQKRKQKAVRRDGGRAVNSVRQESTYEQLPPKEPSGEREAVQRGFQNTFLWTLNLLH